MAQYFRGPGKLYHWAIVTLPGNVAFNENSDEIKVHAYQVLGGPGQFRFESSKVILNKTDRFRGYAVIGEVSEDVTPALEELLRSVPISNAANWNCQNWVVDALPILGQEGYLVGEPNEAGIRSTLAKVGPKWIPVPPENPFEEDD